MEIELTVHRVDLQAGTSMTEPAASLRWPVREGIS